MRAEVGEGVGAHLRDGPVVARGVVGVLVALQRARDHRLERVFDGSARLDVEDAGEVQHAVSLVDRERPLRAALLVSRLDAVGVEQGLGAGEQSRELVGAQARGALGEFALRGIQPGGIDSERQAVDEPDDRGGGAHAQGADGERGGDVRVRHGQLLTDERRARRGRLADLHDLDRLADTRPGRRLDEGDGGAKPLFLREGVLTEIDARLSRDLGGDGGEGGIHVTDERSERLPDRDEVTRRQCLGRPIATRCRERGEGRRDAVEPVAFHTLRLEHISDTGGSCPQGKVETSGQGDPHDPFDRRESRRHLVGRAFVRRRRPSVRVDHIVVVG